MTCKIEIVADDVEAAHEEMLAILAGSRRYGEAIQTAFTRGEFSERWKENRDEWEIRDIEELESFVQDVARTIDNGEAKQFFPEHGRDFERCRRLSRLLGTLIAIKKAET